MLGEAIRRGPRHDTGVVMESIKEETEKTRKGAKKRKGRKRGTYNYRPDNSNIKWKALL
jgi:hypothetical protein